MKAVIPIKKHHFTRGESCPLLSHESQTSRICVTVHKIVLSTRLGIKNVSAFRGREIASILELLCSWTTDRWNAELSTDNSRSRFANYRDGE
ncbi:hypothetical protein EVAR_334_1 [Eumeta japonica]|uniref:Uncharacterized protein n=1 Tax=Eumeta variegata TaxID=151549 RepID=A0A4C1SCW1_EUMVA|nr:hypothetical protein EVAR_334_1 [Eumeta japonica]